jgi:hypothetical protein
MIGRLLTTGCVAAALALSPAERAEADAGEFIGGAIIGGIIGYAAGQNQGQRSAPPPVRASCARAFRPRSRGARRRPR